MYILNGDGAKTGAAFPAHPPGALDPNRYPTAIVTPSPNEPHAIPVFRVPVHEIGYVRMIVESYDGLAFVRSLSAARGEIEWIVGEGMEAEALALSAKLAEETGLLPIERPC